MSRGKDKAPRTRRTNAEIEMGEFAPGRVTGTQDERVDRPTEPPEVGAEIESMAVFAQGLMADPAVREAIRARAKAGTLMASEYAGLMRLAETAPPTKQPSEWKKPLEVASPTEVAMCANIFRRAMGQPEQLIWTPGTTTARTNDEITGDRRRRPRAVKG